MYKFLWAGIALLVGMFGLSWYFLRSSPEISAIDRDMAAALSAAQRGVCGQTGRLDKEGTYASSSRVWSFDVKIPTPDGRTECSTTCLVSLDAQTSSLQPACPDGSSTSTAELMEVDVPKINQRVHSPLMVTGKAWGSWYFEGSFPIKMVDASGTLLGQVAAQAQSDWMGDRFVPFQALLTFVTSTTPTGEVVFQKDNPSGLPEYDAEIRVPVVFETISAARAFLRRPDTLSVLRRDGGQ